MLGVKQSRKIGFFGMIPHPFPSLKIQFKWLSSLADKHGLRAAGGREPTLYRGSLQRSDSDDCCLKLGVSLAGKPVVRLHHKEATVRRELHSIQPIRSCDESRFLGVRKDKDTGHISAISASGDRRTAGGHKNRVSDW